MSAVNTKCPSEALLSDFGLGKLDAASAETVSQHLETCADCRERVAKLSGDSFVNRLRGLLDGAPPNRERTYVPGESLSNAANSTDGSSVKDDGLPRPSRQAAEAREHVGLGSSPSSPIAAPPELTNHPDYELIKELGQGGMGTVYLAKNRMMDRLEVLKVVSKSLLDKPGALERFQQEIRSAARLAHPNIVAAYSVLRPGELLVFAMEYVKGQDLSQVVKQRGPLPVANTAFYIHQVANGLQHAFEKGMVHRDIKPNNLMLAIEGKKHTVKILDFGLAKATSEKAAETGLTKSGQMLGTPDYVAPEQTLDAHNADIRADIYSLGCTLYFLLSGGPPFQEASLYEILEAHHKREPKPLNLVRPEVPVELATVVAQMMAKDPTKRYQTPGEVAKSLVPFFKPAQTTVAPPTETAQSHPESETTHSVSAASPISIITPPVASPVPLVALPVAVSVASTVKSVPQCSVSVDIHRPAVNRRGWWLSLQRWQRWTIAGSAAALLFLGVVLLLRTPFGMVEIQLSDPNANVTVTVDGNAIDIAGLDKPLSLVVGDHGLAIQGEGYETITKQFTVTRGKNAPLAVTLLPDLDGALIRQGDANALNDVSWRIVVQRDAQANDYRRALRLAQAASEIEPETGYYLNTLGVAQYRVGQFAEALETLNRSTKLNVAGGVPQPADVAFLAMTHHALGNAGSAKTFLVQMRELAKQPGWRDNAEAKSLLREAEEELSDLAPATANEKTTTTPPTVSATSSTAKSDEWVPLFNGNDLTGWAVDSGDENAWRVNDGQLVALGTEKNDFRSMIDLGFLLTERSYSNFVLRFQFQTVQPYAFGGVALRAVPHETTRLADPRVQVGSELDYPCHLTVMVGGQDETLRTTGSLWWAVGKPVWRLPPDQLAALKNVGEWNDMEIETRGQSVRIAVNGSDVLHVMLDKRKPLANPMPGLSRLSGRIGILKRVGEVRFRQIEIKELPTESHGGDRP